MTGIAAKGILGQHHLAGKRDNAERFFSILENYPVISAVRV